MDGRRDPFGILYLNESVMPSVEPSHDDVSMDLDYCGSSNDKGFSASGSTDSRSPFQAYAHTFIPEPISPSFVKRSSYKNDIRPTVENFVDMVLLTV